MVGEQAMAHGSAAHRLLAIDQLSSRPRVTALRRALSGRSAAARPHPLGSVSGDGLAQLTYRESLRDIETCLCCCRANYITWDSVATWRARRWWTSSGCSC